MILSFKNGMVMVKMTCVILFFIFTFNFLYEYQADILVVTQHVLSNGATRYSPFVGASLISVLGLLLSVVISRLVRLPHILYALVFLPSLFALGILAGWGPELSTQQYYNHWIWALPLFLVLYIGLLLFCKQRMVCLYLRTSNVFQALWCNLLILCIGFGLTVMMTNGKQTLHYRAKAERRLLSHHYQQALEVGRTDERTDSSLTFLRVLALAHSHRLGEGLFKYPIVGKSDILLPNQHQVRLLIYPENNIFKQIGYKKSSKQSSIMFLKTLHQKGKINLFSKDLLLCALLLDGDIDGFVSVLPHYYSIDNHLPKYYKQALILYNHLRNQPKVIYQNNVLDTDFEDFQSKRKEIKSPQERYTYLREAFGHTYWFYYFYH